MNKLIVDQDFINNFSIAKVKDYEGCPDALRMLILRFGHGSDVLSRRKADFIKIATEDNKPHWIINFLCNMLKEEYKISFYQDYLKTCLNVCPDNKMVQDCLQDIQEVKNLGTSGLFDYIQNLEDLIKQKEFELSSAQSFDDGIQTNYEKSVCQSILIVLKDTNKVYTRSLTAALQKIAEAKSILDLDNSRDNIKLKTIALKLIDFSEIFED
jgi:hypothetical protein